MREADAGLKAGSSLVSVEGRGEALIDGYTIDASKGWSAYAEDPVRLEIGEVTVSAEGDAVATVTIPAATPAGAHALVVTDAQGVELARGDLAVTAAAGSSSGGNLATTGADGAIWAGAAFAAFAAMGLGLTLWLRRRRHS